MEENQTELNNATEFKEMMFRVKQRFPDIPEGLFENIVKDYLDRPQFYDDLYNNMESLPDKKYRDTQDDVNILHYSNNEHSPEINTDDVSVQ